MTSHMTNQYKPGILTVLIVLLLGACQAPKTESKLQSTKKLMAYRVASSDYRQEVYAVGMLSLSTEAKLSFKTGGIIEAITVQEGESISAGTVMAGLKDDEIKANVSNARLQYDKAQRDLQRTKALYADSVATLEQLQDANTALISARNNLEAADFNMKHSQIIAPYYGVVLRILADENETVGAGNPVLYYGNFKGKKVLKTGLTAREIKLVKTGDTATVEFDALPGKLFKGTITQKSEIASPQTNTFNVEISIDDADKQLYSGFIGKAHIQTQQTEKLMSIPVNALYEANGSTAKVFVAEHGKAILTDITLGAIYNTSIYVTAGLHPNQQVIVEGLEYLHHNDPVIPVEGGDL